MENKQKNRVEFFRKVGILLFGFAFFSIIFCGCSRTSSNQNLDNIATIDVMSNDFENIEIDFAEDNVEILPNHLSKANMSTVVLTGEDLGRSDPFMPGANFVGITNLNGGFDLLPPPDVITVDTEATEVITTKVSGILYDTMNPSAIINISGTDYLVRTGDVINGYKVLSITKEYVAVQYGVNVYKAGVGELFNANEITHNTVSNLESKFGGNKEKY